MPYLEYRAMLNDNKLAVGKLKLQIEALKMIQRAIYKPKKDLSREKLWQDKRRYLGNSVKGIKFRRP